MCYRNPIDRAVEPGRTSTEEQDIKGVKTHGLVRWTEYGVD